MFRDSFNNPIALGDKVAYATRVGSDHKLTLGRVTHFSGDSTFVVERLLVAYPWDDAPEVLSSSSQRARLSASSLCVVVKEAP